jgi:hypothetical protein
MLTAVLWHPSCPAICTQAACNNHDGQKQQQLPSDERHSETDEASFKHGSTAGYRHEINDSLFYFGHVAKMHSLASYVV